MDNLLRLAECSFAKDNHLIRNANCLSCGHHVCKKCIPSCNYFQIKCLKCGKINQNDLSKCDEVEIINELLKLNLDSYFDLTCKTFNEERKKHDNLKSTLKEYYGGKVEFYRDEVDIRIESLKAELDKIRDKLHKGLDEVKEKAFKKIDNLELSNAEINESNQSKALPKSLESLYGKMEELNQLMYLNKISKDELIQLDLKISGFEIAETHVAEFDFDLNGAKSSTILSNKEMKELEALCGFKIEKKNLLYRASVDGFQAAKFHEKCDNKPNILCVIKSENGFVFGGFTSSEWDTSSRWKQDEKAFLFSLINQSKQPEKMMVQPNNQYTIYCNIIYGPVFGAGNDLLISNNSNENYSSSQPSSFLIGKSNTYLAGSFQFKAVEIEVYLIENI